MRPALAALVFAAVGLAGPGAALADDEHEGETIHIHNKTGHAVDVYLFQDDHPHLTPDGGIQEGHLKNGESASAHVPNCHFAVLLVDDEDVWHAEFHDCHSTDLTFSKDRGHSKRQ
jgi:hypothetical protein